MVKPDWNIFKSKFSDNPQDNFEWFCYLLFCSEFNKPFGVAGYKNHSYLEHNPIAQNGEVIGWQAKFYDTRISDHKPEIIKLIIGAKNNYPDLTKIIFYSNQNWGQGKNGADSNVKQEIDREAKALGVEIDWNHLGNFFKSSFVVLSNEKISKYFFCLDKSFIDLINELDNHTYSILNQINFNIKFNDKTIEIDRSKDLEIIKSEQAQVFVLSGVGGVGKTAVIKNLYRQLGPEIPFYLFKASEFELRSINDLFNNFNLKEFSLSFKENDKKIIVIDSAEKLLDLNNPDPFKEFLLTLIEKNWTIIFTTRNNYLEDLNYQFFEIYKIAPLNIYLENLKFDELSLLSTNYSFNLPTDYKLLELIKNPFYLNEFLYYYRKDEKIDYEGFRNKLWNFKIKKAKPEREQCFLKFANKRATEGQFFIIPDCNTTILKELMEDGIIGYETAGYFITHDIYEEWALEKIIQIKFDENTNAKNFFYNIGQSLPIRRSFRNWISSRLLVEDKTVQAFIIQITKDTEVEKFWKDEILISVLLSNYAENLFITFENQLLENNFDLLRNIVFLLRIACKEVDRSYFSRLGIKNIDLLTLKYVLTSPKGEGWHSTTKFVFNNIEKIGIKNIGFLIPIIYDWTSKFKTGATTKFASLIALKYYTWHINEGLYFSQDEKKDNKILNTILNGSKEIKADLETVLKQIILNKWKRHGDPYYDLSKTILTQLEGIAVIFLLPELVLQLLDLFWTYTPIKDDHHYRSDMGVEKYFNLEDDHFDYYPESAYKTPILWLLQTELKETLDFILELTNKSTDFFVKTRMGQEEAREINVHVEEGTIVKQYICDRLWCMYRGSQVNAHVLASMHMALEKYLLQFTKNLDSKSLEIILFYLLKRTKSTSISSIVVSIVLAFPEKLFNVAKVLFQTKEFFLYETRRYMLDQNQKDLLFSFQSLASDKNEVYEKERIEACDDSHRKCTLEELFRNYQFFSSEEISEEEFKKRQNILWEILDKFYEELPPEKEQSESDKTWRIYLARMDRRKMNLTTERSDKGIIIKFNPEIEPELKKISEDSQNEMNEKFKYFGLRNWSHYKFENNEQCKQYAQYENNPKQALKEVKEIIKKLKTTKDTPSVEPGLLNIGEFKLFNYSIPRQVCSVLIRDYFEVLSKREQNYCKKVVFETAVSSIYSTAREFQSLDRLDTIFAVLPILFEKYPEHRSDIQVLLILSLFKEHSIDMAGNAFNVFAQYAIQKLWKNNFNFAQAILIGYLLLRPKYDELMEKIRKRNYENKIYEIDESEIMHEFLKENEKGFDKILSNKFLLEDLDIENIKLRILIIAFRIVPEEIVNDEHKIFVKKIISIFAEKLLSKDRGDKHFRKKYYFIKKVSRIILLSPKEDIQSLLQPFLKGFNNSEIISDLFEELLLVEDSLQTYDKFWFIWDLFKENVIKLCENGDRYWNIGKIVKSYLLASAPWKESATEWYTLKQKDSEFFKEMSERIGNCSSTLYSIPKLLNGIGSQYLEEGIEWISTMLLKNKNLPTEKLETNTIYYIESVLRKYIYLNRTKIKKSKKMRDEVLTITDFLISKNSVIGYILRENVI